MTVLKIKVPGDRSVDYHRGSANPWAILVGHSPSSKAPGEVLTGAATADRLRRLLDVDEKEYLAHFHRVNLLPAEEPLVSRTNFMRWVAGRVCFEAIRDRVPIVLLGREVCDTFSAYLGEPIRDMNGEPLRITTPVRLILIPIPHPSPRSVFWNNPRNETLVRDEIKRSIR